MTTAGTEKLRALLKAFAERATKARPDTKPVPDDLERRRQACGERLEKIIRPVLESVMDELKNAGHGASIQDHTDRADAYPSVALAFTPRAPAMTMLASVLTFRCDPRRGIAVSRDMKTSAPKGRVVTSSTDRIGTMRVDAVSVEWVETKTLSFVEAVLKAN
jgi:hypothetical protein